MRIDNACTPDEASAFYIDDWENCGVAVGPQSRIGRLDEYAHALNVGDLVGEDGKGRMRKNFLMFRLPSKVEGKELKSARLRLFLGHIARAEAEKPLPPVWLYHADEWDGEQWLTDPRWHGLQTSHFADTEILSKKQPFCGTADQPGVIEVDVTDWIRKDCAGSETPVAVFRLEVSEPGSLDIGDGQANSYVFYGPGMQEHPDRMPSLVLTY